MKDVISAAELAPQYRQGNLSARLVSRRNQDGKGMTWHLVFSDKCAINTSYDSSSRERFRITEMRKIVRGMPFP